MKKILTVAALAVSLTVAANAAENTVGTGAGVYNNKVVATLQMHKNLDTNIDANMQLITQYNSIADINYKINDYTKIGLGLQIDTIDYTKTVTTVGLNDAVTTTTTTKELSTVNTFVKLTVMPCDFLNVYVKASKDFITGGANVLVANVKDVDITANVEYTNRYNTELKDTNMQNYVNATVAVNYKF